MSAGTAHKIAELEAQAQRIMAVFTSAGYEFVAPAILQPAGIFLDLTGEELRARTYVFSDPDGAELCLRPDLTIPTCRMHLERFASAPETPAKYCYNGAAFRFQPQGANAANPREFRQAGIESFGSETREADEAQTIALIVKALETSGLANWSLHLGDLGLFHAILDAAAVPPRVHQMLAQAFWRPETFRGELARLSAAPDLRAKRFEPDVTAALKSGDNFFRENFVAGYLDAQGLDPIGTRTVSELTERMSELTADGDIPALNQDQRGMIEGYLAIHAPAREAAAKISVLLRRNGSGAHAALDAFTRRLDLIAKAGVDLARADFSAEFGRNLEYYTGLVFELRAPGLALSRPVAGGGRYDRLMQAAGANRGVPAVGAAIHTERLLTAIQRGRS